MTEKQVEEDSFEVNNRQADPDYETIHFNRGRGSQRKTEPRHRGPKGGAGAGGRRPAGPRPAAGPRH